MSLLPKTEAEFAKKEYWNKFFKERGSKEFEWYGEYIALCAELHKYLKKHDFILVIGCGNSMLSSDLFDVGYHQITNIDISSVVVTQMKNKVGKDRPDLIFEQMDAMNMSYEGENFNAVLDKGTLDALLPNDFDTDKDRARKLFSEVNRVLKETGRYIIISLLQKHVLKEILEYFTENGWLIRITRCWDVEKRHIEERGTLTLPVFMIVCVKFKKTATVKPILEVNLLIDGKSVRVHSKEEVVTMIEGIQNTILHCREAKAEIEMKFCRNGEDKPRYSIYVVDVSQDQRQLLKYAAFIVPHGREVEWMFGTQEGRSHLRDSSGFDRLAVIHFHRHQDYGSMDEVQDELRQTILQLAPPFMPISSESPKIPYLTLGDGVGLRKTIYSGVSEYSGEVVVEDVEIEGETFRRLVFMNNQAVVQSEVKIEKVFSKNNKGKRKNRIDLSHIASDHILYMSIPAALKLSEKPMSVAVVGLGGGGLCVFLHKLFPKTSITGVEIDPLVVKLAKEYFGLETDERLKVATEDGVEFIKKKPKFDVVMFDVDCKDRGSPMSCPPPQFVEAAVLDAVAAILGDRGVFVTNVVSRVSAEHDALIKKIQKHFSLLTWYNLKEDVNRIIFASNFKDTSENEWREKIKGAAVALNEITREKLAVDGLMDLHHLLNQLMI